MAWCRMCGQAKSPASNFPWDARTEGNFDGLTLGLNAGSSGYCTARNFSPEIASGCTVTITTSTGTSSGSMQLQVSTNGTSWATIANGTGNNPSASVTLANYVGQKLLFRVYFSNGGGQAHTMTINSLVINI